MRAISAFRNSSSFTLSIVLTSLLMIGVVFITYFLIISNDDLLIRESEAAINADIRGFNSLYRAAGSKAVEKALNDRIAENGNDFFYHLKNDKNKFITGNMLFWPNDDTQSIKNGMLSLKIGDAASKEYDVMAKIMVLTNGHQLLIGRNIDDIEIIQWVGRTFGWIMILILCLISATSIWVAYYVVNRINIISEKADDIISTGKLTERLPVDSNWDDLSKLTMALNKMLDQFEYSVEGIKSVSDNIAHDLRTPLARLKTHIEVMPEGDDKFALLKESDNLLSIFNSLLRIADIESERKTSAFAQHNMKQILEDVVDLYFPVIEDNKIHLTLTINLKNVTLYCDKDLIFQAFANVLDNAIKFNEEGGNIVVTLNDGTLGQQKEMIFSVFDSGPGVMPPAFEKLTQRFYREDSSRNKSGNGLGLALVLAIVNLHKGTIGFIDNPLATTSGLGCQIVLPQRE
ncbi:HAMP domain-containing sensor histidine kinase [Glaciecola sp. 33A]|uniref:sensor histidine kinase n=1 Tax=Glaciecola sp. 33A TaxID=2057807 RepID=UPI000C31E644|nr:HAMP domain-containing sensor histidine kinase [Glaciecola sp. 33A]PKI00971.1 sensor histidine kinase [Glaciecola sp. 33A]